MANTSFRKYVVTLIKSNESYFRKRFYRDVLFDTNGKRSFFYRELTTNSFLRERISNTLCVKNLSQLNNIKFAFNDQMTDNDALIYSCNLLSVCQKKINRYISLRQKYECAYINKDYEAASNFLESIESDAGISLWSCGQKLLLKEKTLGLEGNKSELSNMFNHVNGNHIVLIILYFYSCMAENGLSYENYQTEFLRFIRDFEGSPTGRYLTGKLSFSDMYENKDISFLLQIDSQCSLVDLYNSVERYFPAVVYDTICSKKPLTQITVPNSVKANLFYNFKVLTQENSEVISAYFEDNKIIYEIIENYTLSNYVKVVDLASAYLVNNPADLQTAILFCKSIICGGMAFPEQMNGTYVEAIYAIYNFSDTYREAIMNLKQAIKIHQGSILGLKLHALLKRKHIENGDGGSTFVSSLLDPVIHPNFLRYFENGSEYSETIVTFLSQYCPTAIALSQAIQSGRFDNANIESVDTNKRAFLLADHLCAKNSFDSALEIADKIAIAYSENFYFKEKLQRIRLKSYIGKKDYLSAVRCIVSIYFDNEYMFERLAENGFCTLPRRIRDRELNTDINYTIYRYITSPSDYSRQITAYCNFIEGNHYSNVLEFVNQIDNSVSRECIFFLEKVCSVNLLKRDTTLNILRISAESARLQILQKLSVEFPSKKYTAEIQRLLTAEAIKENLQTINQSRIYADTAKIFSMHQEAWEEIYAKYMALKSVDAYYVDLDIKGQHNTNIETLGFRFTTNERVTQAVIVFKNMVDQMLEECLFSVQFGLETFLSSRIRHGYCKGQLTTFLDDLHLMVKKKTEDSNEYILSEYWGNRTHSVGTKQNIHEALSKFTDKVEAKISEILDTWLRIKYKEGSIGYFDYSILTDVCVEFYYNENYSSFTIFYNKIIATFWEYTQELLSLIRKRIGTELKEYYLHTLSELEGDLKKVENAPELIQEMLASCNLAKARVVQTMTQFSNAFTVNKSSYNDFTMDELVASCKRVAEKSHSNSDKISWKIDADKTALFSGKYFASFVDILNILLSNAIEHSGYEHASDILIQVAVSEVTDQLDKENAMIPNVFMFRKIMCMEVSNSLSDNVDKELLEKKLHRVFIDLNESNARNTKIQSEGGSGLYKLYNVITFNLDTICSLSFDITDDTISIWCYFVADPLISGKETKDENIAY